MDVVTPDLGHAEAGEDRQLPLGIGRIVDLDRQVGGRTDLQVDLPSGGDLLRQGPEIEAGVRLAGVALERPAATAAKCGRPGAQAVHAEHARHDSHEHRQQFRTTLMNVFG